MSKYLNKKIFVRGKITTLTGLHIGGSNTQMVIGGIDNVVIRNPFNDQPYIPGSSLKGKMRSLLEQSFGYDPSMQKAGIVKYGPITDPAHKIVRLFGTAKGDNTNIPSRVIVRDGGLLTLDALFNSELSYTELKTEVMIDRFTSVAMPRQVERVPAGMEFNLDIVVNVWEDKLDKEFSFKELKEEEMMNLLFRGLQLLQDDYLGGKGSRGSGQIKICIESIKERSKEYYIGDEDLGETGFSDSAHQIPEALSS